MFVTRHFVDNMFSAILFKWTNLQNPPPIPCISSIGNYSVLFWGPFWRWCLVTVQHYQATRIFHMFTPKIMVGHELVLFETQPSATKFIEILHVAIFVMFVYCTECQMPDCFPWWNVGLRDCSRVMCSGEVLWLVTGVRTR